MTAAAQHGAADTRLLAAAGQLLANGEQYPDLSVAAIADEAGVARSTFYVYFADKTELLVRLAGETTADIFTAAYEWTDLVPGPEGAAEHRRALETTCIRIVEDYRRHLHVLAAVLSATGYDPVVAAFWNDRIHAFATHAADRLRAAQGIGLLAADVDVDELATMAAWSIERTVSQSVAQRGAEHDGALAAALARGLWLMTFGDSS